MQNLVSLTGTALEEASQDGPWIVEAFVHLNFTNCFLGVIRTRRPIPMDVKKILMDLPAWMAIQQRVRVMAMVSRATNCGAAMSRRRCRQIDSNYAVRCGIGPERGRCWSMRHLRRFVADWRWSWPVDKKLDESRAKSSSAVKAGSLIASSGRPKRKDASNHQRVPVAGGPPWTVALGPFAQVRSTSSSFFNANDLGRTTFGSITTSSGFFATASTDLLTKNVSLFEVSRIHSIPIGSYALLKDSKK